MAVVHDAVSESHTGTTGSTSQASFSWSHNPGVAPKGVLVFTFTNANADDALGVTYDGQPLARVARAQDAAGEPIDCVAWFRGGGINTTDPATIEVTRNNNSNVMYAVGITVNASTDTAIAGQSVNTTGDGTLAEVAVDSGSLTALRYVGANSRLNAVPAAGANTTSLISIDFGTNVIAVGRETTAGSGSRSVGFSDAGSDDRAVVHLAVVESPAPVFDAATTQAEFTTTNPQAFNHTPVGTPRGVLVFIAAADDEDTVSGVTYGGVSMTREAFTSGAGEDGAAWMYFLGSSIPTGTQSVSISHGGTAVGKWAVCMTFTATADTDVADFEVITNGTLDDPRVTLDSSTAWGTRVWGADTGHGATSAITAPLGSTIVNSMVYAVGNKVAALGRESIITTGNTSVGFDYGPGADDTHLVGVVLITTSATPATVTPAVTARSFTVDAASARGAAVTAQSAIARSFTVDTVIIHGAARTTFDAIARSFALDQVTIDNGAADATVTPDPISRAFALAASTQVGGAVVIQGSTAYAVVTPQALARAPVTVTPAATTRSVVIPAVTVKGGSVVQTGFNVTVVMPANTIKSGVVLVIDKIDATVVASQPTIIVGEADDGDKFVSRVWSGT